MRDLWERWLGVGLAAALAVLTIVLAVTGRLSLFLNPDSHAFAVTMACVAVVVTIATCVLRPGAEHDHDHGHGNAHGAAPDHDHDDALGRDGLGEEHRRLPRGRVVRVGAMLGGIVATTVVIAGLGLPPATLSAALAAERATAAPALFGSQEIVALAESGSTVHFGIPDWATVFATATAPEEFVGDAVDLTGFVSADAGTEGSFLLTRLLITHCVIDAQPVALPVIAGGAEGTPDAGSWVQVRGTIASVGGSLVVRPTTVTVVDEPEDPYEY